MTTHDDEATPHSSAEDVAHLTNLANELNRVLMHTDGPCAFMLVFQYPCCKHTTYISNARPDDGVLLLEGFIEQMKKAMQKQACANDPIH